MYLARDFAFEFCFCFWTHENVIFLCQYFNTMCVYNKSKDRISGNYSAYVSSWYIHYFVHILCKILVLFLLISLCVCLPVSLPACLSVCLPVCLSLSLSFSLLLASLEGKMKKRTQLLFLYKNDKTNKWRGDNWVMLR